MKSIFRTIALLVSLLLTASCNIDFLYIQLPDTSWRYELDGKTAWVHFGRDERACVAQMEASTAKCLYTNGLWTAHGHAVLITDYSGNVQKLTRTFSHLKNSKNKNFSGFSPKDAGSLENTVWAAVYRDSLVVLGFGPDTKAQKAVYKGLGTKEATWVQNEERFYAVTGSHIALEGPENAISFGEVLLYEGIWLVPVQEQAIFQVPGGICTLTPQTSTFPFIFNLRF